MREAIERLITDFKAKHDTHYKRSKRAVDTETISWNNGVVECFEYVLSELKVALNVLPKAIDSTAHAQADTDTLPFEPTKQELED